MDKLLNKIISICSTTGLTFKIDNIKHVNHLEEMTLILNTIEENLKSKGINPADVKGGKGHRISILEKAYLKTVNGLEKMLEYNEQVKICGSNRNSYYKTVHDATAMCLKEDYYSGLGSNMHAGYNVQVSV